MEKTGNIVHNVLSCAIGKEAKSEVIVNESLNDSLLTFNIYYRFIVIAQAIFASNTTS